MHIIAAKAVCFKEAAEPAFADYQRQIVANAAALAAVLRGRGLPARQRRHRQPPDARRRLLARAHRQGGRGGARQGRHHGQQERDPVRQNPPMVASGIRVGTPAVTTRGMREPEMDMIGEFIARVLATPDDEAALGMVRAEVEKLCRKFPLYPGATSPSVDARRGACSPTSAARWRAALPDFEPRDGPARDGGRRARRSSSRAASCSPRPAPAPARRSPTSFPPSSAGSACSSRPAPRTSRSRSTSRTCPCCARRSACRSRRPT